ncbi:MAG TPA: hypothetical protein VM942_04855, partial [Acidimicrobiales bacterium]|nr:hypothetical protein [Acidimicrobiales bacterium]
RLPTSTRNALLAWVEQGGHLLVDADPGQTVEGLPGAWQPGQDGRSPAGRGEVRLTGGAIAAGRWSGLVEPTGWAVASDPSARFGNGFVGHSLADEAGLRVPRLGWLVAFLVVYVLFAGPVVFLVVRRRGQPELAWIAVPVVAVMFTAGSYVGGRGLRDTTRQVDTSIVATGVSGSTATTWLGVFSAGGHTSRLRFGPGWMPAGADADFGATTLSSLAITPDGVEGSLPLDAGQFGVVPSSGPAGGEGSLEVSAVTVAAGEASGRVKNSTSFTLDDVAVFVGTGELLVGRLGPGEEREWRMIDTDLDFFFEGGGGPSGFRVWGGADGFSPEPGSVADFSLWETARRLGGQEFLGPGEAVAAGWTRSFAPPVAVDGRDAGGGRTLVLGRGRVQAQAASSALDIRREVVRAPDNLGRSGDFVVRFVTRDADGGARAPDPARLVLRGPLGGLDVWQDGGWKAVRPDAAEDLELRGRVEFDLPAGAVQGDLVYVRFPANSSAVDDSGLLTLREADR